MISKTVTSLIYVSRRTLPGTKGATDVEDILQVARERNKVLRVTGALFSASNTFAQFIEGSVSSIYQLMESIKRDPRHRDVRVVSVKDEVQRKFPKWTMAYSGDEHYIDRHIGRLLDVPPPTNYAEWVDQLEALMEEFSKRIMA